MATSPLQACRKAVSMKSTIEDDSCLNQRGTRSAALAEANEQSDIHFFPGSGHSTDRRFA
jgi:hypothetical protein